MRRPSSSMSGRNSTPLLRLASSISRRMGVPRKGRSISYSANVSNESGSGSFANACWRSTMTTRSSLKRSTPMSSGALMGLYLGVMLAFPLLAIGLATS